jgi:hypothetical protein
VAIRPFSPFTSLKARKAAKAQSTRARAARHAGNAFTRSGVNPMGPDAWPGIAFIASVAALNSASSRACADLNAAKFGAVMLLAMASRFQDMAARNGENFAAQFLHGLESLVTARVAIVSAQFRIGFTHSG